MVVWSFLIKIRPSTALSLVAPPQPLPLRALLPLLRFLAVAGFAKPTTMKAMIRRTRSTAVCYRFPIRAQGDPGWPAEEEGEGRGGVMTHATRSKQERQASICVQTRLVGSAFADSAPIEGTQQRYIAGAPDPCTV